MLDRGIVIAMTALVLFLTACTETPAQVNNSGHEPFEKAEAEVAPEAALDAYEEALDAYELAQESAPEKGEPYYNAANTQYRMEAYDEALRDYDEALKYAEDDLRARGLFNKGNVYFDTQQYPDAIEAYKEVLRIQPDNEDAKHNLELALSKLPEPEQGEEPEENDQEGPQQQEQQQDQQDQQRRAERTRPTAARPAGRTARPAAKRPAGRPGRGTGARTASATAATSDRADYSGAGTRAAGKGERERGDPSGAPAAGPRLARTTASEPLVDTDVRYPLDIRSALAGIALAVALIAAAVQSVHAQQQDIDVTAEVDKTELAVGEEFTLWIKIDGALNPRQPAIPNYDGIRRLGPPSTQWVRDGTGTTVFAYVYRFEATKVGKVTIEPISVTVSGQTLSTEQVEVEVFQGLVVPTPGPGQGQPSSDDESSEDGIMFVTASVDDDKPYLGQQVTYTFKFYRRSVLFPSFGRFGQPRYAPPGFSGFWNGQQTDQNEYLETIGPDRYQVVELQTVLFPTVVGTLVIEPAGLTVPIDFFESPNFPGDRSHRHRGAAFAADGPCGVHRRGRQLRHIRRGRQHER